MLQRFLAPALKLVAAFAILFLLARSGKLDLRALDLAHLRFGWILFVVSLFAAQIFLATLRWKVLLAGAGVKKPFLPLLKLTWTGQFLGSVMLGALGGDVVRMYYVMKVFKDNRAIATATIIFDRLIGLTCLIFFAFLTLPIAAPQLLRQFAPHLAASAAFLVFGGLTLGLTWRLRHHLVIRIKKIPWDELRVLARSDAGRRAFYSVFALSLVGQLGVVVTFYAILKALATSNEVPFFQLIWVSPIVLLATAVPLTPSGIGVGQAVLAYLFFVSHLAPIQLGTSLATLFQVLGLLANCFGVVSFFRLKKEAREDAPTIQSVNPNSAVGTIPVS